MAASKSIVQVAGSGTGDIERIMPANGPPGMAAMVSVAPAPMVRVFCATDVAVSAVPASSSVVPAPETSPAVWLPASTSNVAPFARLPIVPAPES